MYRLALLAIVIVACVEPRARRSPQHRQLSSAAWKQDRDRDGIPDACDACPDHPEDIDCPVIDGCPGSHCRRSCHAQADEPHRALRVVIRFEPGSISTDASAGSRLRGVARALEDPAFQLYVCRRCRPGDLQGRRIDAIRLLLARLGISPRRIDIIRTEVYCARPISDENAVVLFLIAPH